MTPNHVLKYPKCVLTQKGWFSFISEALGFTIFFKLRLPQTKRCKNIEFLEFLHRHDICQKNYTTGVFGAKNLPEKARKSPQKLICDKTAYMLQNVKFTTTTLTCFKITFIANILQLTLYFH